MSQDVIDLAYCRATATHFALHLIGAEGNLAIPIMMAHGTHDPMIPIMRAATSRENLMRMGFDVRWFDYPMGHQVCLEEVVEIAAFFAEVLPR